MAAERAATDLDFDFNSKIRTIEVPVPSPIRLFSTARDDKDRENSRIGEETGTSIVNFTILHHTKGL